MQYAQEMDNEQERENTEEVCISVWETNWMDDVADMMNRLAERFDIYHDKPFHFRITIVLEEGEEDDQSIPSLPPS